MSRYRVVLENEITKISCHRVVQCVSAESSEEAGELVQSASESANPQGWRVIQVREVPEGTNETGYYRHGEAHLALA